MLKRWSNPLINVKISPDPPDWEFRRSAFYYICQRPQIAVFFNAYTAVEAIVQSCRSIEYFNLYGSEFITDSSISKIAKMCPKIQDLDCHSHTSIKNIAKEAAGFTESLSLAMSLAKYAFFPMELYIPPTRTGQIKNVQIRVTEFDSMTKSFFTLALLSRTFVRI
ncbi:hypothetical protein Glove_299g39 [Diversispora epigaea]|uniref:Uncharacterized protein n=1 Tax=Diversispora epigaea TaxID=1348612 RepID=A0A397I3F7_9GLOM|nr:hypothetical protein Glove_299g39 [Diversispora epigaea]